MSEGASPTANTRGFTSVLGILTGLDVLTALYGAMFASGVFSGASPMAGWPWFAWLFAGAIVALPVLALIGPIIAWFAKGWQRTTRLIWAVAPLGYAALLSIAMEVLRQTGAL